MIDREKVISNFEHEVNKTHDRGWGIVDLSIEDAKEILALLKEQEPVKPITDNGAVFRTYACGNCKTYFYLRQQKYCAICGRAVKWDEGA